MLFSLMISASLVFGLSFSSLWVKAFTNSISSVGPITCCCLVTLFGESFGGVLIASVGVINPECVGRGGLSLPTAGFCWGVPSLSSSSNLAFTSCANTAGVFNSGIGSPLPLAACASGALGVAMLKWGTPTWLARLSGRMHSERRHAALWQHALTAPEGHRFGPEG